MAACDQCGAPVKGDAAFCSYCGARLGIIGEALGRRILQNTEAIRDAVRIQESAADIGLQRSRHTELNDIHSIPLARLADERLVNGIRRPRREGFPFFSSEDYGWEVDYSIEEDREDPYPVRAGEVRRLLTTGQVEEWLGGWVRCGQCHSKFHFTRDTRLPEGAHDHRLQLVPAKCPACMYDLIQPVLTGKQAAIDQMLGEVPSLRQGLARLRQDMSSPITTAQESEEWESFCQDYRAMLRV